jgi:tetratricopeptide (TPR) repeat protein
MSSRSGLGLTRAQLALLFALTLVSLGVGFWPLFGGPGYELALALGLLLPLPVACMCALQGLPNGVSTESTPLQVFADSIRYAVIVCLAALVTSLGHGLRVGFCDLASGLVLLVLGPFSGTLLAAAWGSLAGLTSAHLCNRVSARRRGAVALGLALCAPVGGVLVSAWRFWSSPMIFAFDPFVGFFAGTLYDTVIDAVPRLITYRTGSAGSLLASAALLAALSRSADGRLALGRGARHFGPVLLGAAGAALSLGIYVYGPHLGHYQTTTSIREVLSYVRASRHCEILYDPSIGAERAELLGRECDSHVENQLEFFGGPTPQRISVLAFASSGQKGRLMGASNTYIAKPWRSEVYVQNDNYPHPVLGHEVAHVMAGSFARGPWRVAGPLGGWWPDPGRIEGFAVAASPALDSDYTLIEWTRALRDLGLLPRLQSVFRLSFLGQNSSTAYTVAGAVVEWLRARYGRDALRAWYAGAPLEQAFGGAALEQLEQAFLADLERVQLSDRALDLARARFDRPAIFGRRCPHVVDRYIQDAEVAFERLDFSTAALRYQQSLALDPHHFGALLGVAACSQRQGNDADARARYSSLANDPSFTRVQRGVVLERLGDLAYWQSETEQALEFYAEAERFAFDEHRARSLAVKQFGLLGGRARASISELLMGDPLLGSDVLQSGAALGSWAASEPGLGLADYLIGKNLYGRGRFRAASEYLQRALARDLPLPSVRREALRSTVFVACALGDRTLALPAWTALFADPGLSLARKNGMQRFAPSCGLPASP